MKDDVELQVEIEKIAPMETLNELPEENKSDKASEIPDSEPRARGAAASGSMGYFPQASAAFTPSGVVGASSSSMLPPPTSSSKKQKGKKSSNKKSTAAISPAKSTAAVKPTTIQEELDLE